FVQGEADAGILFRIQSPSLGFDAQKGYYAALIPRDRLAILGKTDGQRWTEIARAPADFHPDRNLEFSVTAAGPEITVKLEGNTVLTASDDTYTSGSVGLRVVETHARFRTLEVKGLDD